MDPSQQAVIPGHGTPEHTSLLGKARETGITLLGAVQQGIPTKPDGSGVDTVRIAATRKVYERALQMRIILRESAGVVASGQPGGDVKAPDEPKELEAAISAAARFFIGASAAPAAAPVSFYIYDESCLAWHHRTQKSQLCLCTLSTHYQKLTDIIDTLPKTF